MSDFDREAEREKLREKYERDEQKREATERMSDLLLNGATMTNAHCGNCRDPIFRYEGQEFCPTCQELVSEDGAESDASETDGNTTASDREAARAPSSDDGPADDGTTDDGPTPVETEGSGHPSPAQADGQEQPTQPETPTAPQPSLGESLSGGATPAPSPDGDLGDAEYPSLAPARASLTRTINALVGQVEAAEDLERTRAYLAAVEEAADALAAVERADR